MAKVLFTPWKEHRQLLAVRDQFYPPPAYNGPDMRAQACATIAVWKIRGNLPHAVEATALLTDAVLHDDAQKNSVFSIRATYSAAFCRFVTGLVDSKLHGQRKTMFQRAVDLGLPASFVELRHEATHRELPSLTVLRNATQRSLEWLWDYYWAKTDLTTVLAPEVVAAEPSDEPADGEDLEPAKALVKTSLDQLFVKGGETTDPPRKKRKVQQQLSSVATQLGSICRSCSKGAVALSRVLLNESVLVPSGRTLGSSLSDVFTKWDRFLQDITEAHPPFLVALAEGMVDALAFDAPSDAKSDARCEGIYQWLDHILGSSEWASRRWLLPRAYLISVCEGTSSHWTALLKETLRKVDDGLPRLSDLDRSMETRGDMATETLNQDTPLHELPLKNSSTDDCIPSHVHFVLRTSATIQKDASLICGSEGTGKGNNYAYLVTDEPTKQSVIIDPANPPEVAPELQSQIRAGKIDLTAIVNTHHHWDHAGGNNEMLKTFGQLPVIGGRNCQSVTKTPAHGETFKIGERISVKALHTPCHTQDSICYFMQDGEERVVFTGDTLFIGGCGRFFEGTAPEMHKALNETLASLPDDTKVYPGHEYTKGNVKFCLAVSQSEPIKKLEAFAEQNQQTQGKFTIGDEKLHNVFMRVNDPEIQQKTGKTDPVEVMAALREMKNAM
ncbi:beta-lactamase-like protein [Aspergillus ambiguus]|uniref:beta-lactamase-like protein n=1 Tax=Aspergillus ambiguus TaxID=176160 RepID=UPI003CCDFFB2